MSLDPVAGTFALPLWAAGLLAALFVVVVALAFSRNSSDGPIGALIRYAVVAVGALAVWVVLDRSLTHDDGDEWRALEIRGAELAARAMAPDSPLSCLDGTAGKSVEDACERILFATPQSTAAATSYTAAQLALLLEAAPYVGRGDGLRDNFVARQRRALEADPYGLVAHVLATRYGCTAEQCSVLALLGRADQVKDHLRAGTYQVIVDRHVADWGGATDAMANAPSVGSPLASFNFPSAASIPPVSIMTGEPGAQPDTTADTPPPPPGRPQTQRRSTGQTASPVNSFGPLEVPSVPPPLRIDGAR